MAKKQSAYLSIGSNEGIRKLNLQKSVFLIDERLGNVIGASGLYESPAWGFEGEDFLNACILLKTDKSPQELLAELLKIEREMGRERAASGGYTNRTIDLDIIYYGKEVLETDDLKVPHPQMQNRRFVLKPLADIAPQFYHPKLEKDTRNLLQECPDKTKLVKTLNKLYRNKYELFSSMEFITIEGNIGAGKTTLAHKIAEDFNAKLILERFADNPFLPNFYEDQARFAFPLEMSFLADRYQQFTDDTSQFDLFKNFMISDYDIYKSLIFAKVTLQKQEFELYRKVFSFMYKEVKKPKIYVYLYQTTERLLENIKKRGRDYEQNIAPEYLEDINRGYFDYLKTYPKENQLVIDITEHDFVNKKNDYATVLEQIEDFAILHHA
ncbi:2-amino-4-hydroxy-6-hydroxymethyldihydropteridine diphosphokinase [Maribacter sp. 2210JD10-5]|uniref:2-amino-4-hydroxy-6- hydroxymethyldihydropteridine diphosphokinase n=1 Tax=Maribacter sp. 2210JD10-5 TaxID=3386272 RepID=UPI0039BC7F9C